nr:hypothetical protein Iba_chr15cCG7910 [Ipomoea batatas]
MFGLQVEALAEDHAPGPEDFPMGVSIAEADSSKHAERAEELSEGMDPGPADSEGPSGVVSQNLPADRHPESEVSTKAEGRPKSADLVLPDPALHCLSSPVEAGGGIKPGEESSTNSDQPTVSATGAANHNAATFSMSLMLSLLRAVYLERKAPLTATADVSAPEQPITCLLRFNALMLSPRYVLLPVRTAQLDSIFAPRGTMGDILPAGFG